MIIYNYGSNLNVEVMDECEAVCNPTDVDECARGTHNCDSNANCTNTEGSFFCTCNPGYTGNSTNGTCTDIDECLDGNGDCKGKTCYNTDGSYQCLCPPGYKPENMTSCIGKCRNAVNLPVVNCTGNAIPDTVINVRM